MVYSQRRVSPRQKRTVGQTPSVSWRRKRSFLDEVGTRNHSLHLRYLQKYTFSLSYESRVSGVTNRVFFGCSVRECSPEKRFIGHPKDDREQKKGYIGESEGTGEQD